MKKRTYQCGFYVAFSLALGCSSAGGGMPPDQAGPEVATTPPPTAPAPTEAAPTTAAASFSAAQAGRGRTVFDGACSSCHSTGDFRGNSFIYSWRQRTAWNLYRQVVETMPEDAPGSLRDEEYIDIVAYILELNGHDAGDGELAATEESLGQIPVDPSGAGTDAPDYATRPAA